MPEWKQHGVSSYHIWEEQLAPDRWLVCFRPNEKAQGNPHIKCWINVYPKQWSTYEGGSHDDIEEYKLDDEFMQLCVMHEMRKKYGSSSDDSS